MAMNQAGCRMPGFTLVDITVAAAIVAILALLAYPSYQGVVRKARRTEGRAALMQALQQEERFYTLHSRYLAFSAAPSTPEEQQFKWYSGDSPASSAYEISGAACMNETIGDCVAITARPGTARVNAAYTDPDCENLIATSTGALSASGHATNCW